MLVNFLVYDLIVDSLYVVILVRRLLVYARVLWELLYFVLVYVSFLLL